MGKPGRLGSPERVLRLAEAAPPALNGGLLLCPDDHGRYIGGIDRCIEEIRSCQLGKMNQFVADLLDLAADLFAGFHPQLDDLADVFLENPQHGVTGLEVDFALGEKA